MLKTTFYTLTIAVLIAGASMFGYFYSVIYVGGMGSDLSDLYQKSDELSIKEQNLNSIKRVAQSANQNNSEISKYIVSVENEGSIQFVKKIEDLADRYNLKYNTNSIQIVPDDELSKINKEYLSIKETVIGSDSGIAEFVKKIDSAPYNLRIRNYSLTKIVGANAKGGVDNKQLDVEILVVKEK